MAKVVDLRLANAERVMELRQVLNSAYVPHDAVDTDPGGPSMTRQEFAEECDVNAIMARYEAVGGHLGMPADRREPRYLDLTALPSDLMSTLEQLHAAEDGFMSLPARVRAEFDNDPVRFVEYASDPGNLDRMREWGLAPPARAVDAPPAVSSGAAPGGEQRPEGPPASSPGAPTQ